MASALTFKINLAGNFSVSAKKSASAVESLVSSLKSLRQELSAIENLKLPDLSGLKFKGPAKIKVPRVKVEAEAVVAPVAGSSNVTGEMAAFSPAEVPTVAPPAAKKRGEQQDVTRDQERSLKQQQAILDRERKVREAARKRQEADEKRRKQGVKREAVDRTRTLQRSQKDEEKAIDRGLVQPNRVDPTLKPIKLTTAELGKYRGMLSEAKMNVDGLSTSQRQMKAAGGNIHHPEVYKKLSVDLRLAKQRLVELQRIMVLSGNAAKFGREGTNRLVTTLKELAEAAGGSGITGLAGHLARAAKFGKDFGEAGSQIGQVAGISKTAALGIAGIGIAAIATAAAVVGLTVGITALIAKGAQLAFQATATKQSTMLLFESLQGTKRGAHIMFTDVENVARDFAISEERATEIQKALSSNGNTNTKMMRASLRAVVQAGSINEEAGSKLQSVFEAAGKVRTVGPGGMFGKFQRFTLTREQLMGTGVRIEEVYKEIAKRTGKSVGEIALQMSYGFGIDAVKGVDALAAVIDRKFGGAARAKALQLPVQFVRLGQNIKRIFSDVNVTPLLEGISKIVEMFDSTTVSGLVMKEMVTTIFDGIFRIGSEAVPYVQTAIDGLVNVILNAAVGLKPVLKELGLIGTTTGTNTSNVNSLQLAFLVLGQAIGFASSMVSEPLVALIRLVTTPFKIAAGWIEIFRTLPENILFLNKEFDGIGGKMVDGLISGVESAASRLYAAIRKVGTGAVAMFKFVFKIASPSKVMEGIGLNIDAGMAGGIRRGVPMIRAANDNAARAVLERSPLLEQSRGSAGRTGSGSEGGVIVNVNLDPNAISVSGGSGADAMQQIRDQAPEVLADVFEQAVRMAGLAPKRVA